MTLKIKFGVFFNLRGKKCVKIKRKIQILLQNRKEKWRIHRLIRETEVSLPNIQILPGINEIFNINYFEELHLPVNILKSFVCSCNIHAWAKSPLEWRSCPLFGEPCWFVNTFFLSFLTKETNDLFLWKALIVMHFYFPFSLRGCRAAQVPLPWLLWGGQSAPDLGLWDLIVPGLCSH